MSNFENRTKNIFPRNEFRTLSCHPNPLYDQLVLSDFGSLFPPPRIDITSWGVTLSLCLDLFNK